MRNRLRRPTPEARAADAAIRKSYDRVPYPGAAEPATHPDRLATLAILHGLDPAPVGSCRVLELGCSDGGNLIPMASALPASEFLGIDLAAGHVAAGRELVAELGLSNVELRQGSVLDVDSGFGRFDYIVAHGVLSWVPLEVQNKILEIFSQNLAPRGVAYVSYNTFPGWHQQRMVREMMLYHARGEDDPERRVHKALEMIDLLARAADGRNDSHSLFLASTHRRFGRYRQQSSYLVHDYLEEHNHPLYFHQLAERARAHGLEYLAEAGAAPVAGNLPPAVGERLAALAAGRVELEQYMDFATNRSFRRTLLCHRGLDVAADPDPKRLPRLLASSSAKPVATGAEAPSGASETFRTARGNTFSTDHPTARAVLHLLSDAWPQAVASDRIAAEVQARSRSEEQADPAVVSDFLLSSFLAGVVELHTVAPRCVRAISALPRASPLARRQAARGSMVTNQHHRALDLDDPLARTLLRHLDGQHDRPALIALLVAEARAGRLEIRHDGEVDRDPPAEVLGQVVDHHLRGMAELALLVG